MEGEVQPLHQDGNFRVCPTCLGKGFFEDPEPPSDGAATRDDIKNSVNFAMPKIRVPTRPTRFSRAKKSWKLSELTLPLLPSKIALGSGEGSLNNAAPIMNKAEKMTPVKRGISQLSKDSTDSQKDYTIEKKEIKNFPEFIRATKIKLKSNIVDEILCGVINTVQIARQDSDTALTIMPQVNRHLCTLLKSLKHSSNCIAFEAVKELYSTIPLITRPEFDDMIQLLLGKVSDMKATVREGANAALDVIAANTPPQYLIRALRTKGPRSKNAHIRESSARLLNHLVDSIGPEPLLNSFNLRELRMTIIESGLLFLDDKYEPVRKIGKEMMSKIIKLPEFEDIIVTDVPQSLYRRVEKIILNIKYER